VSVRFVMKWSRPRHNISAFWHEMVKPQTWYQCFVMKWGSPGIASVCFQTDTMSEVWPFHDKTHWYHVCAWSFHDKTHWYYIWGLTISWQNALILCQGVDHLMTKHTVAMPGLHCFMTKHWYHVWGLTISWQCVLSWNGQDLYIISVCFVMKWSNPRHSISMFCHEMVKTQK
jgi:hypothetical protein